MDDLMVLGEITTPEGAAEVLRLYQYGIPGEMPPHSFDLNDETVEVILAALDEKRWIPVEEKLPDKEGQVLAYYGFDHGSGFGRMFMQVLDYYAYEPKPHFQHESMGLRVTHWMPLPKPPKEDKP